MSAQNDELDDMWGQPAAGAGAGKADSAFTEPSMVVDEERVDPTMGEDDASGHEHTETSAPVSKPNVGMLAGVAVIGLALLGGAGYILSSKFSSKPPRSEAVVVMEPVSQTKAGASVFDAPSPGNREAAASLDVFDAPVKDLAAAPSAPASAPPAPSAFVLAAVPVSGASAPVATALATSPTKVEVMAAKPVAAPVVDAPLKVEPVVAVKAVPSMKARVAAARTAKVKPVVSVATKRRPARILARAKSAPAVATSGASGAEEFMLPRGLKVQSVYPTSGENVQAWIADQSGRVEIVRVGESLKSGATVTRINAERGEVITSAGTITGRRIRQ